MSASQTFTLTGLAGYLEGVGDRFSTASFRQPLETCRGLIHSAALECFRTETAPDGTPWTALAKQRVRPKGAGAGEDKILQDTGLLRGSVTGDGDNHVEELTDTSLTYGSNLEYAAVHQYGHTFDRPEKSRPFPQKPWVFMTANGPVFTRKIKAHSQTVPARPFLGFTPELKEQIREVFKDWVREQLGGGGSAGGV